MTDRSLSRLTMPADLPSGVLSLPPPTFEDCLRVLYTFTKHIKPQIPPEIALLILGYAYYSPRIKVSLRDRIGVYANHGSFIPNEQAVAVLLTPPLPAGKISKVLFWVKSNDQGWSGEPMERIHTYTSHTWFETRILRPIPNHTACMEVSSSNSEQAIDRGIMVCHGVSISEGNTSDGREYLTQPLEWEDEFDASGEYRIDFREFPGPGWVIVGICDSTGVGTAPKYDWVVQRNLNTCREPQEHHIEWGRYQPNGSLGVDEDIATGNGLGKGFVSTLSKGDRICLIARAKYPGWKNMVHGAQIQVIYAFG